MSKEDAWSDALDQVLAVVVLLGNDMEQAFRRDGLTGPRVHLLWELQHRGPSTQRVLADAVGVTPRNITGLVDGLVETGFVTREPHPTDRRAALVTFTDRGAEVAAGLERGQAELARQLFADLPPRKLAALNEGLTHVVARLQELTADEVSDD